MCLSFNLFKVLLKWYFIKKYLNVIKIEIWVYRQIQYMENLPIHEYKLFAKMLPLKQNSSFGFKNRQKN